MPDVHFSCPHCDRHLQVEEEASGCTVPCPSCQQVITVPSPEATSPPPDRPSEQANSDQASDPGVDGPPPPPSWRRRKSSKEDHPTGSNTLTSDFANAVLGRSLSPRVLTTYFCGLLTVLLVCGALLGVGIGALMRVSMVGGGLLLLLDSILLIGLGGVLVGCVAQAAGTGAGNWHFRQLRAFLRGQFLSLFISAILFFIIWHFLLLTANGLVALIGASGQIGSSIAALLFLPQAVLNAAFGVVLLSGVLVPVATARGRLGPWGAIPLLARWVRCRTVSLLVHTGSTMVFASILAVLLYGLYATAFGPTLRTNGPELQRLIGREIAGPAIEWLRSRMESETPVSEDEGAWFEIEDDDWASVTPEQDLAPRGQAGDKLRIALFLLTGLMTCSIPSVFWIVSFEAFYSAQVAETKGTAP